MEEKSLIHIIPSNKWGGVQNYALDICRHYLAEGWDVTAVTRNAVAIDSRFSEAGISLLHAPLGGFFDLSSAYTLARKLRTTPPGSVIHTHRYRDAFTAVLAKKIAKRQDIRLVSTRHSVRRGRNSFLYRKIYKHVDAHIFVSQMAYDGFRHTLGGEIILPEERVHILHDSIFLPQQEYISEPQSGPISALYQGSIVKGKGLETLIDAMAQLKGTRLRLRIVGTGNPDYLDMLRRRAIHRDVMDSIDWNLKQPAGIETCLETHFGVVPSIVKEAFSLESLRFMSAGRPQVATDNGAQKEYLKAGETAFLVPPGDASKLANAMRELASDRELRLRMGRCAYNEFTSHLSWQHFINALNKIYS